MRGGKELQNRSAAKAPGSPVLMHRASSLLSRARVRENVSSIPGETAMRLRHDPDSGVCGKRICLAFTGSLYPQTQDAAERLRAAGHEADLYNLRFLKPIDEDYLVEQLNNYDVIAFIEEGIRSGGFGEYAAALAGQHKCRAETMVLAVEEDFSVDGRAIGTRNELLRENKLDGSGIAEWILGKTNEQ